MRVDTEERKNVQTTIDKVVYCVVVLREGGGGGYLHDIWVGGVAGG